jgi:hypothetical protein
MKWLAAILGGLLAGAAVGAVVGYVTYAPDPSPYAWNFGPGMNAFICALLGAPIGVLALPLLVCVIPAIRRKRSAYALPE